MRRHPCRWALLLAVVAPYAAAQPWLDGRIGPGLPSADADVEDVVVGDFNGDGHDDLLLRRHDDSVMLLGDGRAAFSIRVDAVPPLPFDDIGGPVAAGDVNGDGRLDLVVAREFSTDVLAGDGTGGFASAPLWSFSTLAAFPALSRDVALFDADNDGDLDFLHLIWPPGAAIAAGNGDGTFGPEVALPVSFFNSPSRAALADVDGDGLTDIILNGAPNCDVLRNLGGLGFAIHQVLEFGDIPVAGDLDGDGDPDLVLTRDTATTGDRRYENQGGFFSVKQGLGAPQGALDARLADHDGDGDLDFLATRSAGTHVYRNTGTGFLAPPTLLLPLDFSEALLAVADHDQDGDIDVAHLSAYGSSLSLNDGDGAFTRLDPIVRVEAGWRRAAADVDGDGDLDVVHPRETPSAPTLYRNDGWGRFTAEQTMPALGGNLLPYDLADVDQDGDPDCLVGQQFLAFADTLLRNDGTGTFTDQPGSVQVPLGVTVEALLFDADGDAWPDALLGRRTAPDAGGGNRLLLNSGGALVDAPSKLPSMPGHSPSAEAADFDGDGDLDLLLGANPGIGNVFSGQDLLFVNDGSGGFADETTSRMPPLYTDTRLVLVDDVDGDGDLDGFLLLPHDFQVATPQRDVLLRNDGTGRFIDDSASSLPATGMNPFAAAFLDVDGDGDRDVVRAPLTGPVSTRGPT